MNRLLVCTAAALLLSASALADSASGIRAYDSGLYDIAAKEFLREAAAGDAEAQFRLGTMYADGVWFRKDRDKAMDWLGQAAIQGHQGAIRKIEAIYDAEAGKPIRPGR